MLLPRNKVKRSAFCSDCQNRVDNCWIAQGEVCVRYLPERNTNLTDIKGTIETPPGITDDIVCQMFTNWIDSLGWHFTGSSGPHKD